LHVVLGGFGEVLILALLIMMRLLSSIMKELGNIIGLAAEP
jgi:hypothetical protein